MTERVAKIGANDTSFENPHGLDAKEHYTTAHDLSLIAAEALANSTFREIAGTYKYSFKLGDATRTVINHNKLLRTYDGCIGVKTGFTKKSGRCLVSAAEREGITLVAVTLDDPDDWRDHQSMLDYGFDNLESINIRTLVDIPESIPTISKDYARIDIKPSKNNVVKAKGEVASCYIDLPSYIARDVTPGEAVGSITVKIAERTEVIDIIAPTGISIKNNTRRLF
jgi:D-alanyl-D-alanine carboxypeptidase/D-alanyl-D-alanine carboxypeptidase (penicillin-binding protein 5/6)